jgi:hypothetical protein
MTRSPAAVLRPRQPRWMASSAAVAASVLAIYVALALQMPWQPGRLGGLIAGSLAAALFVNAALYPARRRWRARPLGTAQRWLQLHIYGSAIATLLVLVHVGFRWPSGLMGWWLFVLTLWTTATGVVGVYLQKSVPLVVLRSLRVEAIYERIPELSGRLLQEADALMDAASEMPSRTYHSELRPLLERPAPSWTYVLNSRGNRAPVLDRIDRLTPFADEADRGRLADLRAIVDDKADLDAHMSLQRALRAWLALHVPAAMLLLALLAVHIFAVVYL